MSDGSFIKGIGPQKGSPYSQGYFTPLNVFKYLNPTEVIIYRSSLEKKFCELCDISPNIIKWQSEPFGIPYLNPIEQKVKNYYPDFLIVTESGEGIIRKIVVEVKPKSFITKPIYPAKVTLKSIRSYNRKLGIYVVNMAKYKAARFYCEQRNMKYTFLTESFFDQIK
jgi:hypothetical protein